MPRIEIFVVGYERPDLLAEQKRLCDKFLTDEFGMCLIDNTPPPQNNAMQRVCEQVGVGYCRPNVGGSHHKALNYAANLADEVGADFWGTWDHDIFPKAPYGLIDRIKPAGFYGVGQTHPQSRGRYLFPGFAHWSREWLNGRIPDYTGIRGTTYLGDGDTGSGLISLFTEEDWARVPLHGTHGYGQIRPDDGHGVQSFGFEVLDDAIIHFTNAANWLEVPDPGQRTRLLMEMIRAL